MSELIIFFLENVDSIGVVVALFAVSAALISARNALVADKKVRVLEFVTNQFDRDEVRDARNFINRFSEEILSNNTTLQDVLKTNDNQKYEKIVREYLRSLDRIGNGLHVGALDLKLFFKIWQPAWVIRQSKLLSSVIKSIETETGIPDQFAGFAWLVKKSEQKRKCSSKGGQTSTLDNFGRTVDT